MNAKSIIILVAGAVVVGVAIQSRFRRGEHVRPPERTEPVSAKRALKPRLPAPRMPAAPAAASEAEPGSLAHTNVFGRLQNSDSVVPAPNRAQVESYLARNRRSAESLLAAYQLTHDTSLLQEAAEKYPKDPRVNYAGWFVARAKDGGSPAECRQWLDAFKRSAPDNALADYLSAQAHFQSGQTDLAVEDLLAASGKSRFQDYAAEGVQNLEEAYVSAGNSLAEAKAEAAYSALAPHLRDLKNLGQSLADLAARYRQAGDEASAGAVLQMGVALGQRLTEPAAQRLLINDMVGLAIERRILEGLDPASPYDAAGHSVKDRLDGLRQQVQDRKSLWKQAEPILQNLPDQELVGYFDRMKVFGESEALRWVMNRQGGQ